MQSVPLPKSVAIIGAGASGLFAARRLRQLGVEQITLFEKENHVGGKCCTYHDPKTPGLIAERGAVVIAPNYGEVIDALIEHGIKTEKTFGAQSDTVEIIAETEKLSWLQKWRLMTEIAAEVWKFNRYVRIYRNACEQLEPLPGYLEESFGKLAKDQGLQHINIFLKPFVSGFGYGDMNDCPAYSVLEYMGYMTIPCLIAQHYGFDSCELRSIEGGFQNLMNKIGENFDVKLSTTISHIKRDAAGVKVDYTDSKGIARTYHAEMLVLAVSPKQWLGLLGADQLTSAEKACVDQLTYYSYPVVICRLKGLPLNYIYKPEALNKEHFGHVAFVATLDTRENPEDGRLCSAYINQLPRNNHDANRSCDGVKKEEILSDLRALQGVTEASIVEYKIWEDYFPTVPWQVRLNLEKEQYAPATRTIYTGSYALGSFEDVACVANRSTQVISKCLKVPVSSVESFQKDVSRFFNVPH